MFVVLGIGAGIAAYKVPGVLRLLQKQGHQVQVIPTPDSLNFVGSTVWESLSGRSAATSVFSGATAVDHVSIGRAAELVLIAPATADLLARAANGRADDLLTATLLTARCPVLFCPAMHTEMWEHPATQANVARLRDMGYRILRPASGALAGPDSGPGRLPEPTEIAGAAAALLQLNGDTKQTLVGKKILITAGGTYEDIDPVRYIANRSSGKQGMALARAAWARGAEVELIAANIDQALKFSAVKTHPVRSAADMAATVAERIAWADLVIMAAAVADYAPESALEQKMKKDPTQPEWNLVLRQTTDILALATANRDATGPLIIGFAAETGTPENALALAQAKARRKGADLLVFNRVGKNLGFEADSNEVKILDTDGTVVDQATGSKDRVAGAIMDTAAQLFV